jgi:hypothetical protein
MGADTPKLHYETVEARARPARVAVLINSSDPDWFDSALRIIEFLSSIWGGKHSIIVPTDGLTIDLAFWKILEQFSPDYVYFYRKTGADFKLAHPEEYSAELLRAVEQYQAGLPTIDEHEKDILISEAISEPKSRTDSFPSILKRTSIR